MGELTRIYSCGDSMTMEQLIEMVNDDHVNGPEYAIIDVWFPETMFSAGWNIPLTDREILAKLPQLIGKTIVTVSEIIILMMQREIRKGRMQADKLELWCGDRRIHIGINGEMIDMWDGGFFEMGFNLRFS